MIQRKRSKLWARWAIGVLAGAALVTPVVAQSSNALLDALIRKGVLTEQEAKEIEAELEPAPKPAAPVVRPSSSNIRDLQIRGRIHGQFGYTHADNDEGSDDYSTLEMRRVRLGMRGTLFQNIRAQIEANFIPNTFSMRSAFLEWREHEWIMPKMGFDKPVFGYEENTSSASILTVERSNINNQMVPGPTTGVSFSGGYEIFTYGAGVYTGRANVNPDGFDRYLYNGSVGVTLDRWMPENHKLSFRLDGITNDDNGAIFGFETGVAASSHYIWGPFDVRVEYMQANPFQGGYVRGGYIMPSYKFTDKIQGVVRYERSTANGTTLNAPNRYARRTDVTPAGAGGGRTGEDFEAIYIGANYYIKGDNLKLMAGVEYSELDGTERGTLKSTTLYGAVRMLY
jgi:phosphate-selective porin OprO and OprP